MSPYTQNEKRIYNRGYRQGARRMVVAWLGGKCEYCGETDPKKLEIAHKEKVCKPWRDYTDWLDRENLLLLCQECNQKEENHSRRKS